MEIIAAATVWALFSAFLIFPLLGLPAALQHAAAALIVAEGAALMLWGLADPGCRERPCAPASELGYTAAKIDIPLLALALLALAVVVGVRGRERQREEPPVSASG